jgi:hypothetical protein
MTNISDVRRNQKTWTLWFPIFFFEIYLSLTVILFAFGPWHWPVNNDLELYGYLIAVQVFLFLGYAVGVLKRKRSLIVKGRSVSNLVFWSLAVNLALLLPTAYARSGSLIPHVWQGLINPGSAYTYAVARASEGGPWVFIEYARILLAPLLALAYPVIVATWSDRSRSSRALCVFVFLFVVCIYISMGTNKAIIDSVLLLPWLIFLGVSAQTLRMSGAQMRRVLLCCVLFILAGLAFFGYGQVHREGGVAVNSAFGPPLYIFADRGNWLTSSLPDFARIFIESISRYACQGYYALSKALQLSSDFSFGVGNSMFLGKNIEKMFHVEILQNTFPGRLDSTEGWGMYSLWDSIYPWIASDVGFIGSLMVIFLIGYFFSLSWIHAIKDRSPFSIVLASYFIVMLFYFPANNQIMQNGESCIGFCLVLLGCAIRYHFKWIPASDNLRPVTEA